MHCAGGEAPRHSFIHNDHARTGADLPATSLVNPIDRALIHEEECVTVLLHTGLQSIGCSYSPVTSVRSAVSEENSLASLSADHEAGFNAE